MEIVRKSKEIEKIPTNQGQSLNEQIKSIKSRNQELEKYKILCEQRIQEILPDHPIPIKEEHLGLEIPYIVDLTLARQKISKLKQQLSRLSFSQTPPDQENFETLAQEKSFLEECLRAEVLNCEEQRTYIEILKQRLEENPKNFERNERKTQDQKSLTFDLKREIANLKSNEKDLESLIVKLKNSLKAKEDELEMILQEKQSNQKFLHEMNEKISKANEENLKLEEEKNSLLEYIEEHSTKEIEMEKEMNELAKLFDQMKGNYSETMKKFHEESLKNNRISKELEEVRNELQGSLKLGREMQNQNENLKEKINQIKTTVKKLKQEKIAFEVKAENLLINNATLSETLKEIQDDLENFKSLSEKKAENLLEKEELILHLKSDLLEKQKNINSLQSVIHSLEREKIIKIEEKAEIFKDFEIEKQKIETMKAQTSEAESRVTVLNQQLIEKSSIIQNQDLKIKSLKTENDELNNLKVLLLQVQEKHQQLGKRCEELLTKNEELLQFKEKASQELLQLKEKTSQEIQVLNLKNFNLSNEIHDYEKIISENKELQNLLDEEKINFFKEEKERKEQEFVFLRENHERLEKISEILQVKLNEEQYLNEYLQDTLKDLKLKLEGQEMLYVSLKKRVFSTVFIILDYFPGVKNQFKDEYSIFSLEFRDFLEKLAQNSSPDLEDVCKYSEFAAKHLKFLLDVHSSLQDEISNKNFEISMNFQRIEALNSELETRHQRVLMMSQQIDSFSKENFDLKAEFQVLSQENFELKNNLNKYMNSLQDFKVSQDHLETNLKSLEFENKSLKNEKNHLENLIKSCRASFLKENVSSRNELENLERDRLDIQYQMLKFQSDPRSRDGKMFKELGNQLELCEKRIQSFEFSSNPPHLRTHTPNRHISFQCSETPVRMRRSNQEVSHSSREKSYFY
jgi:chromosome segregation ATPase